MTYREVTMIEMKEILRLWLAGVPGRAPDKRNTRRKPPGRVSSQWPPVGAVLATRVARRSNHYSGKVCLSSGR